MSFTFIDSGGRRYRIVDLAALGAGRLPVVHRILIENLLRRGGGDPGVIADWLRTGASTAEIPFWPTRIMMHDTTRSAEHTSELQSLMRLPSAVSCLKKKPKK